jgi:hypothetical protein
MSNWLDVSGELAARACANDLAAAGFSIEAVGPTDDGNEWRVWRLGGTGRGLKRPDDAAHAEAPKRLGAFPSSTRILTEFAPDTSLVHVFVTRREDLAAHLGKLRSTLPSDVAVWVSWPEKSAKVSTTVTEDVIRDLALSHRVRRRQPRLEGVPAGRFTPADRLLL